MADFDDTNYFHCRHCDAKVRVGAKVCRACGASDDCGWNDDSDSFDYGDASDDFDYDDFVKREFGESQSGSAATRSLWLRLVILAILLSFALGYLAL